ncbi:MAG: hypothetical protein NVS3B20_22730 [Polyangiales bacterium]
MSGATKGLLDGEEVAEVLSGTFYVRGNPSTSRARHEREMRKGSLHGAPSLRAVPGGTPEKPPHYKVICISLYNDDLSRLDGMVDELKERGFTKANRSALIRFALENVDLTKAKKGL